MQLAAQNGSVLSVGEHVLTYPDKESRKEDAKLGYKLGVCIGRIVSVDADADSVTIQYLYGSKWNGKWIEWKGHDKKFYTDTIRPDQLLNVANRPDFPIARLTFDKSARSGSKLDKPSKVIVKAIAAACV